MNPYQPPAPAADHVVHYFNWRTTGTTLTIGTQERHAVSVGLDLLTGRTIVQVDERVVHCCWYFFDPPPIRLEVGESERHEVEVILVASLVRRPSHITVDGTVVVPEISPQYGSFIRVSTIAIPSIAAACAVWEYWDPLKLSDWVTRLLTQVIVGLAVFLVAFVVVIEIVGAVRMNLRTRNGF